jgi:hypothetical protein
MKTYSYYRFAIDSKYNGEGVQFIEFENKWATRQVECYGDKCLSVDRNTPKNEALIGLCDQPLRYLELLPGDAIISEQEFEEVWDRARGLATAS